MKKCICNTYQLTIGDIIALAPSKRKIQSISCPECKETIQATKQSKVLFVAILVTTFIGLGFTIPFLIPETSQAVSALIILIGLAVHYLLIWPQLVQIEKTQYDKT